MESISLNLLRCHMLFFIEVSFYKQDSSSGLPDRYRDKDSLRWFVRFMEFEQTLNLFLTRSIESCKRVIDGSKGDFPSLYGPVSFAVI